MCMGDLILGRKSVPLFLKQSQHIHIPEDKSDVLKKHPVMGCFLTPKFMLTLGQNPGGLTFRKKYDILRLSASIEVNKRASCEA